MRQIKLKLPHILLGIAISGPPRPRFRSAIEAYQGGVDSSAAFELIIWSIIFVYAFHIMFQFSITDIRKTVFPNYFLKGSTKTYFLFSILAILSTFFSVSPLYTLYFALKVFSTFIIASFIAQKSRNEYWILFKVAFVTYIILFIMEVIFYLLDPAQIGVIYKTGMYRLTGGWLGGYGMYAAHFALACIILYFLKHYSNIKKIILFIAIIFALYFVLLARTRQTFIYIVITILPLLFLNRKFAYTKLNMALFFVVLLLSVYLTGYIESFVMSIVREKESISTLSSRTIMMNSMLNQAEHYLPWGDGYEAGSRSWLIRLGFAERGLGASHDSVSKILVELGIPGALLLLITLILLWKEYLIVFYYSIRHWRNGKKNISKYVLTIYLGSCFLFLTISLPANDFFASGNGIIIVYLLTLQMLIRERNISIHETYK